MRQEWLISGCNGKNPVIFFFQVEHRSDSCDRKKGNNVSVLFFLGGSGTKWPTDEYRSTTRGLGTLALDSRGGCHSPPLDSSFFSPCCVDEVFHSVKLVRPRKLMCSKAKKNKVAKHQLTQYVHRASTYTIRVRECWVVRVGQLRKDDKKNKET